MEEVTPIEVKKVEMRDYDQYATSIALHTIRRDYPQLFEQIVDKIVSDLGTHYDFPPDSFPTNDEKETKGQKKEREELVSYWMEEFFWDGTDRHRHIILTLLFY